MKTLAVVSIFALALSGCATGYYHRDYAGYGSGYTTSHYYNNYGGGYYRPGANISIERYYSAPRISPPHREHHHHDHDNWRPPAPMLNHRGFDRSGWEHRGGEGRHDHHIDRAPRRDFSGPSSFGNFGPERHHHESGTTPHEGRRHFPGR